jgi:HK97 family phage portal protein
MWPFKDKPAQRDITPEMLWGTNSIFSTANATQHGTVAACVRVISQTISTMKWTGLEGMGQRQDIFLTILARSILLSGVAYVVSYNDTIYAVNKTHMNKFWDGEKYVYRMSTVNSEIIDFTEADCAEIFYETNDGITGLSPMTLATSLFNIAGQQEAVAESFPANAAQPGMAIIYPTPLPKPQATEHKTAINTTSTGVSNAGKTLHLFAMQAGQPPTIQALPQTALKDSQLLESRQFSAQQIAAIYGVPLHLINQGPATGDIETQNANYITYCIRPLVEKNEWALCQFYQVEPEACIDDLLRGNTLSRYQSYAIAKQWGWMSVDDIRIAEGDATIGTPEATSYGVPANIAGNQNGIGGTLPENNANQNAKGDGQ